MQVTPITVPLSMQCGKKQHPCKLTEKTLRGERGVRAWVPCRHTGQTQCGQEGKSADCPGAPGQGTNTPTRSSAEGKHTCYHATTCTLPRLTKLIKGGGGGGGGCITARAFQLNMVGMQIQHSSKRNSLPRACPARPAQGYYCRTCPHRMLPNGWAGRRSTTTCNDDIAGQPMAFISQLVYLLLQTTHDFFSPNTL